MTRRTPWLRSVVLSGLVATWTLGLDHGAAQSTQGSGVLSGTGVLAVRGCGRDRLRASLPITTWADGTWSVQTDVRGALSGRWTALDARGRRLDLAFDAPSAEAFAAMQANDLRELCRATSLERVTVEKRVALLVINRRGTRATLVLRFVTTATVDGKPRVARDKLRLAGRWVAG